MAIPAIPPQPTFGKSDKIPKSISLGDFPTGGLIGTAAATVDKFEKINIGQTTSAQVLVLPDPTSLTNEKVVYVQNTGTVSFLFYGIDIAAGSHTTAIFNGGNWSVPSAGGVPSLTANRGVVTDASGSLTTSTTTDTELGYLSGTSSNIQAQIDAISSPESAILQSFTLNFEPGLATQNIIGGSPIDLGGSPGFIQKINSNGRVPIEGFYSAVSSQTSVSNETLNGRSVAFSDVSARYLLSPGEFLNEGVLSRPVKTITPFSMAFACVIKMTPGYNQVLFDCSGTTIYTPWWNDGNIYIDLGSEGRRISIPMQPAWSNKWVLMSGFYVVGHDGDVNNKTAGFRINGTDITPTSIVNSVAADSAIAFANAALFAETTGYNPFRGGLAQLCFLTPENDGGETVPEDVKKTEGFLAHKWGLEGDLDAGHPYKTSPAAGYPVIGSNYFDGPSAKIPFQGALDALNLQDKAIIACSNRIMSNTYTGGGKLPAWGRIRKGTVEADIRFNETTGLPDITETYYPGTTIARGESVDAFSLSGTIDVSLVRFYNQVNPNKDLLATNLGLAPKLYRASAGGGFSSGLQTMNGNPCFSLLTFERMRMTNLYQAAISSFGGFTILNIQQLGTTKGRTIDSTRDEKLFGTWGGRMAGPGTSGGEDILYVDAAPVSLNGIPATTKIQAYGLSYDGTSAQSYVDGQLSGLPHFNNNIGDWGGFSLNGDSEFSDVAHQEFVVLAGKLTDQQHLDWFNNAQTQGLVP